MNELILLQGQAQLEAQLQQLLKLGMKACDAFLFSMKLSYRLQTSYVYHRHSHRLDVSVNQNYLSCTYFGPCGYEELCKSSFVLSYFIRYSVQQCCCPWPWP